MISVNNIAYGYREDFWGCMGIGQILSSALKLLRQEEKNVL